MQKFLSNVFILLILAISISCNNQGISAETKGEHKPDISTTQKTTIPSDRFEEEIAHFQELDKKTAHKKMASYLLAILVLGCGHLYCQI